MKPGGFCSPKKEVRGRGEKKMMTGVRGKRGERREREREGRERERERESERERVCVRFQSTMDVLLARERCGVERAYMDRCDRQMLPA